MSDPVETIATTAPAPVVPPVTKDESPKVLPINDEPTATTVASSSGTSATSGGDSMEEEEAPDEEENLFLDLEKKEEAEAPDAAATAPPSAVAAAPRLLQAALNDGQVNNEGSKEAADGAAEEKKEEVGSPVAQRVSGHCLAAPVCSFIRFTNPHTPSQFLLSPTRTTNQQANQLEFLLSKASEYSNFIANDLQELQSSMTEKARKAAAKAERKKKRKADPNGKTSKKKAKTEANQTIFLQPPNLAEGCFLKDYQLEGVRWLASLFENGVSGILADGTDTSHGWTPTTTLTLLYILYVSFAEMGLGKTIQCVSLIAHLLTMGVSGPFLVVAPLATLPNWVREFEKWLPHQPVVRYHGPAAERDHMLKTVLHPKLRRNPDYPFIVTSFEVAIRDQTKLEKLSEFTYVIVDEGHRLKNHRCTLIRSLKKLRAANRLLLTGYVSCKINDECTLTTPVVFQPHQQNSHPEHTQRAVESAELCQPTNFR